METTADRTDTIDVPRAVRFPVELRPPPGFDPERLDTWPKVDGRLEYVGGRLLYMPPCGTTQGPTVGDAYFIVARWGRAHPEFVTATNEQGMRFAPDTRAADVAIWRRADQPPTGGLLRVAPVLAVEVAGDEDREPSLREKAAWLVLPNTHEVVVMNRDGESRHRTGRLPPQAALPDLTPEVDEFFVQISRS
jgi:Uma2 family endonuclease